MLGTPTICFNLSGNERLLFLIRSIWASVNAYNLSLVKWTVCSFVCRKTTTHKSLKWKRYATKRWRIVAFISFKSSDTLCFWFYFIRFFNTEYRFNESNVFSFIIFHSNTDWIDVFNKISNIWVRIWTSLTLHISIVLFFHLERNKHADLIKCVCC